ncbi:hypothetical protein SAMN05660860_00711 [Geoalkalibacter ferrihydriticus]|uniref:Uncharacterized protein n=1 Tax=Geoalkalibacter ferrihydriticus TaxID=392333 RepID=A0A1G9KAW8_9BACT|nr:hypothetical protein SAMN05660860_00711 [Geoalkalibacter ferrihydriticus]
MQQGGGKYLALPPVTQPEGSRRCEEAAGKELGAQFSVDLKRRLATACLDQRRLPIKVFTNLVGSKTTSRSFCPDWTVGLMVHST